jgi:hypothetical protein
MDLTNVWKDRNEELIHKCLEEAYRKKGYLVTNIHKSDRRHEGGVDLVCENADEKINIQVKIKPLGSDVKQLNKLSNSKSDKKIFVYIENPVVAFANAKDKINNIEFWNREKLHDFLIDGDSTLYFRLLFLSSTMVRDIVNILETITSCQVVHPSSLEDDEQMGLWWIFKDRAVKLHGSLELIYEWYKPEFLSKDKLDSSEIKKYLESLFALFDKISRNSSRTLSEIVKKLKRRYPQLLAKYVKVTERASNWIGMPYHKDNLRERIENWILPEENMDYTFYSLVNYYLSKLKDVSEAIEDGVDWVFEDKFNVHAAGK